MEEFIEKMAEIMEVEPNELTAESEFRSACDFDSLMGFSMICMMEDEYGKRISVEDFMKSKTIKNLYQYIS